MQPNNAMKFAEYVARILLCISVVNLAEKIFTTVPEISNFLYVITFLARPVYFSQEQQSVNTQLQNAREGHGRGMRSRR